MARPRRRTRPSISLFPFLSVLACVIGTLTLVITATATSQVASGAVDLERYERLEQEIETNRRQLAALEGLSSEVETLAQDVDAARERAERLERERRAAQQALARNAPLREALRTEEERLAALERELSPLRAARERAQDALEARRQALARAKIRIQPAGSGYGLDPYFVECRPEGIVYYAGVRHTPEAVPTHRIASSAGFTRFLRAASFRPHASVVFLIREGGVDACEWARGVVVQHRLRHGEIPLVGDGPLDFSAVEGG